MTGILVVVLSTGALGSPQHWRHRRDPKWIHTTLKGTPDAQEDGVYDPRTGFMMDQGGDCDGADLYELLTADRYEMAKRGFNIPNFSPLYGVANGDREMKPGTIPLMTNDGVRIGDSEATVASKTGKPTKIVRQGSKKQFVVYEYSWHSAHEGRQYDNSYFFKAGKLIEINLGSVSDDAG